MKSIKDKNPQLNCRVSYTQERFRRVNALRVKYVVDRLAAFLLLLVLSPFGVLITLAIVAESLITGEKPVILVSEERKSAGRNFRIWKFRLFRVLSIQRHLENRKRRSLKLLESQEHLTRAGTFLKRYYLDELPQLLNIAMGQMSIVGPRPHFSEDLNRVPALNNPARQFLKAGLLGPVQAAKGKVTDIEEKISLEMEYLEKCTTKSIPELLLVDIKHIVKCFQTALQGKGL